MKNKQKIKKNQIIFCSSQKRREGSVKGEDIVPETKNRDGHGKTYRQ